MNLLFIILDLTHFLRISQVWIVSSEPYDLLQVVKFIFTFEDVFTSQKCCMKFTVGFFDDGDNHFTGDVAAHDERVGFVEFSCVNEFQETFLGAMEICSEEDLGAQLSIFLMLKFLQKFTHSFIRARECSFSRTSASKLLARRIR